MEFRVNERLESREQSSRRELPVNLFPFNEEANNVRHTYRLPQLIARKPRVPPLPSAQFDDLPLPPPRPCPEMPTCSRMKINGSPRDKCAVRGAGTPSLAGSLTSGTRAASWLAGRDAVLPWLGPGWDSLGVCVSSCFQ